MNYILILVIVLQYTQINKKSRPYSISSGIYDNNISFLIRKIPNGDVSEYLSKLKKNQGVKISEPFGWFKPIKCLKNEKNIF